MSTQQLPRPDWMHPDDNYPFDCCVSCGLQGYGVKVRMWPHLDIGKTFYDRKCAGCGYTFFAWSEDA